MKTVIYYFSHDGNTQWLAERISAGEMADLCRLIPYKEYPRSKINYLVGGMGVVFGLEPQIAGLKFRPTEYDTVIIATPVWASSFVPPIKSFLAQYDLRDKDVILVATSSGGDATKCFKALRKRLTGSRIVGEYSFVSPIQADSADVSEQVSTIRQLIGSKAE